MKNLGKLRSFETYISYKNKSIKIEYAATGLREDGSYVDLLKSKVDFCEEEEEFLIEYTETMEDIQSKVLEWAAPIIDKELVIADKKRRQFFAIEAAKKKLDPNYQIAKYKAGYK
jgi:hypothetical protein